MTDTEAMKVAEEAANITLPPDAPDGVRARFTALVHLGGRVHELLEENKRLVDVDDAARRQRGELFEIESAAKKAGLTDIVAMAQKARLGAVAAASINRERP
jgi:hypothetical protein